MLWKPQSMKHAMLLVALSVALLLLLAALSVPLFAAPHRTARAASTSVASATSGFVTRDANGTGLTLNGAPFRFAGANIYWLGTGVSQPGVTYDQQVSSILQVASADPPNGMSGTVVRAHTLGISSGCGNDTCVEPTLGNIPQTSAAFSNLDYAIWQAGQDDVRLVIPFVDYWNYGPGGIDTWLSWHGYPIVLDSSGNPAVDGSADYAPFFTDPKIISDFETYIGAILNHVNSITGIPYKDDPTILAWEEGNEINNAPASWISAIANYIKSQDSNHLVAYGSQFGLQQNNSLGVSGIDIEDAHYYPMNTSQMVSDAQTAYQNGKVYYIGEFAWNEGDLSGYLSAIETTGQGYLVSGDTYWSLFPKGVAHNDGFTLHFPGDDSTMDQDITLLTSHAQAMRAGDHLGSGGGSAPVGQTIWLKASNGLYASTRIDQTNSPLDASASTPQAWEEYTVVDAGNGMIALRSVANGLYVSAWLDDPNTPLEARSATTIQAWEEFTWISEGNNSVALQANANNLFVSAWQSDTNTPLEARSTWIQAWETFQWGTV